MRRVGQNYIYTVYIRHFWQRNHQIYGHIRCIYTILANPKYAYFVYFKYPHETFLCCLHSQHTQPTRISRVTTHLNVCDLCAVQEEASVHQFRSQQEIPGLRRTSMSVIFVQFKETSVHQFRSQQEFLGLRRTSMSAIFCSVVNCGLKW
jgi:hypothetical protein